MKTLAITLRRPTWSTSYRMKRWLKTAHWMYIELHAWTLLAIGFTIYSTAAVLFLILVLSVALPDGHGSRLLQDAFWSCLDIVRDVVNYLKGW